MLMLEGNGQVDSSPGLSWGRACFMVQFGIRKSHKDAPTAAASRLMDGHRHAPISVQVPALGKMLRSGFVFLLCLGSFLPPHGFSRIREDS